MPKREKKNYKVFHVIKIKFHNMHRLLIYMVPVQHQSTFRKNDPYSLLLIRDGYCRFSGGFQWRFLWFMNQLFICFWSKPVDEAKAILSASCTTIMSFPHILHKICRKIYIIVMVYDDTDTSVCVWGTGVRIKGRKLSSQNLGVLHSDSLLLFF